MQVRGRAGDVVDDTAGDRVEDQSRRSVRCEFAAVDGPARCHLLREDRLDDALEQLGLRERLDPHAQPRDAPAQLDL
ncbi:hypothetical protein [Streptomyces sp. CA-106110]|uniref:hypothetical protein n=1 Tax=Streptomyces sp. CA-106110 TaxID=3240044 RepID=UPI003D8FEB30